MSISQKSDPTIEVFLESHDLSEISDGGTPSDDKVKCRSKGIVC